MKLLFFKKMVKHNEKSFLKIAKEGYYNKHEIVTEIFLKNKNTKKQNLEGIDLKIFIKNTQRIWKSVL